jgi:hypothetical protein
LTVAEPPLMAVSTPLLEVLEL